MNAAADDFPALGVLNALPGVKVSFFARIPGVPVVVERAEAMQILAPHHHSMLQDTGLGSRPFITAEQIHGNSIAVVDEVGPDQPAIPGVDGLFTTRRNVTLGIYVADCAPVWVLARDGSAGALLHSGKKGSEPGIVLRGIALMQERAGIRPEDLIVAIGPCIRTPCYDVDFAAWIRADAKKAGAGIILDDDICTACHPERYYSYRREKGLTGRMLATLSLGTG